MLDCSCRPNLIIGWRGQDKDMAYFHNTWVRCWIFKDDFSPLWFQKCYFNTTLVHLDHYWPFPTRPSKWHVWDMFPKGSKYIKLLSIIFPFKHAEGISYLKESIGKCSSWKMKNLLVIKIITPCSVFQVWSYFNTRFFFSWQVGGVWFEWKEYSPEIRNHNQKLICFLFFLNLRGNIGFRLGVDMVVVNRDFSA